MKNFIVAEFSDAVEEERVEGACGQAQRVFSPLGQQLDYHVTSRSGGRPLDIIAFLRLFQHPLRDEKDKEKL
jgi:nitrogen fixation protein FixH